MELELEDSSSESGLYCLRKVEPLLANEVDLETNPEVGDKLLLLFDSFEELLLLLLLLVLILNIGFGIESVLLDEIEVGEEGEVERLDEDEDEGEEGGEVPLEVDDVS